MANQVIRRISGVNHWPKAARWAFPSHHIRIWARGNCTVSRSILRVNQVRLLSLFNPISSRVFKISDQLLNNNLSSQIAMLLRAIIRQCLLFYITLARCVCGDSVVTDSTLITSPNLSHRRLKQERYAHSFRIPLGLVYLSTFRSPGPHSTTLGWSHQLPQHHLYLMFICQSTQVHWWMSMVERSRF